MSDVTASTHPVDPGLRVDGVVDALRETLAAIKQTPSLVPLFLVVGFLGSILGPIGAFVQTVGVAIGIYLVTLELPMSVERSLASNSLGVRILLAILAGLVGGVVIIVGLFLLVLPGLYAAVRLYLVYPAVVVGDDGPVEALSGSWERTTGDFLTVAGVMLAVFGASLGASFLVLVGTAGGLDAAVRSASLADSLAASVAGSLVGGVLNSAAMAVLYDGLED